MTALFNRDFAMKMGAVAVNTHGPMMPKIDDDKATPTLRTIFDIEKTSSSDPNSASIQIYNLGKANRELLKQYAGSAGMVWPVFVEVGYMNKRELIFVGDILTAESTKDGVDWVTTIEASDGGKSYASKRFSKSFGPGTPLTVVISAVVNAFGIGPGNAIPLIAASPRQFTAFKKGVVVHGRISEILDKYIASAGYQWSIQDGQLQLIQPGKANLEPVALLNRYAGLIGSPEKGEKGKIVFSALLQGSIRPGRRVVIESITADGIFIVEKARYVGDTWGGDWTVEAEAYPETLI